MLILPSWIPLPKLLPSLLAPRSVVPLYLDPRTRTRRRAAVFGCGAGAFCGLRCDGVTRGPAGASAGRRGGPKRLERAGQALRPSFKSWSGVREPCAAGAPGRAPQCSDTLRSPWGLCTGRHGCVHVAPPVKNGFYCAFARRPFRFLGRARREAYARVVPAILAGPAWCKKPGGTAKKRHENLPKRRTLGPGRPSQTPDGKLRRARSKPGSPAA